MNLIELFEFYFHSADSLLYKYGLDPFDAGTALSGALQNASLPWSLRLLYKNVATQLSPTGNC